MWSWPSIRGAQRDGAGLSQGLGGDKISTVKDPAGAIRALLYRSRCSAASGESLVNFGERWWLRRASTQTIMWQIADISGPLRSVRQMRKTCQLVACRHARWSAPDVGDGWRDALWSGGQTFFERGRGR